MVSASEYSRITNQLAHFGCNSREASIYIECLRLGPTSIQDLSRQLKFNRVTVHSAVSQLIGKGFLFETRKGKKRLVVAEAPEVFSRIIQKKQNELMLLRGNLDGVIELLNSVRVADSSRPAVKFYEGIDGFKGMLEETLTAKGEVLVFTYVDLFSKLLGPDYLEDYFVRRAAKGIHTRLIFPPCPFADRVHKKAKEYKIQVRLLPADLQWQSGIFSWNNAIALKSFTHGKITCTIVENEDIAYFYRQIVFELSWKQAMPMSK